MFFSKKRDIKLLEERCGNVVRYAHIFFFILTQYISIKYTFFYIYQILEQEIINKMMLITFFHIFSFRICKLRNYCYLCIQKPINKELDYEKLI